MSTCYTCELTTKRDREEAPLWDAIYRTTYWDVVHAYNTALLGWLVLVLRRHVSTLAELTPDEASEMGLLIQQVSSALKSMTSCVKTYAIQFADHPDHPHVHVHIVPVMADLPPERKSTQIFGYLGVPEEERVSEAEMNAFAEQVRAILRN